MKARELAEPRDDGVFFLSDRIAGVHDRRLDLLNVKFVVVTAPGPDFDQLALRPERFAVVYREGSIAVFENKSVLPRAFAVPQGGAEVIPDPAAQQAASLAPASPKTPGWPWPPDAFRRRLAEARTILDG